MDKTAIMYKFWKLAAVHVQADAMLGNQRANFMQYHPWTAKYQASIGGAVSHWTNKPPVPVLTAAENRPWTMFLTASACSTTT
jgi:hypothetical protein